MAPKVSQTRGGGVGVGVGVGAPKVFKKKSRRIVAYHWGRALLENESFAQIQEIPSTFSIHGLFGKKISKKFKGPAWDPTILSEYFKFCLRERWANCEPNKRTDPKKHLDHHNEIWKKEYSKHFPDLMMNQKEYLVYTFNKFNSVRVKLNNALNESCRREPIDLSGSGRRQMNINEFLKLLKKDNLVPSIHVRTMEKLDIQLLTEVRFYFHPQTDAPISPPTYTKKVKGHCDFSKPLFVA